MKVFLSWSGTRSKAVAQAFCEWLPQVIQSIEPWISSDIAKGARWTPEVSAQLETTRVGIICLTEDNRTAPWILFESGALSKTKDAHVCTFLLDIKPASVEQPLAQFQHTTFHRDDVYQLVQTINAITGTLGERGLTEAQLESAFGVWWPKLEDRLKQSAAAPADKRFEDKRSDRDLLEEVLEMVRTLQRPATSTAVATSTAEEVISNDESTNHYRITFPDSNDWTPQRRNDMAQNFEKRLTNLIVAQTTPAGTELVVSFVTHGGALARLKETARRIAPTAKVQKVRKTIFTVER